MTSCCSVNKYSMVETTFLQSQQVCYCKGAMFGNCNLMFLVQCQCIMLHQMAQIYTVLQMFNL